MTVRPYALRTGGMDRPLGVDLVPLDFTWRLASARSGAAPATQRVILTRDATGEALWDSGDRVGSRPRIVAPHDLPLAPLTRYRWSVLVTDERGDRESEESWFETGLLRSEPSGFWVRRPAWVDQAYQPPTELVPRESMELAEPAPYLRREFVMPRRPQWARLLVAARGVYRAFVNGTRIGDHELAPGWTDYRRGIEYRSFDVGHALRAGENALAILLGDGWWSGYVGFEPRNPAMHYGVRPEAWAQLVVRDEQGVESVAVATDSGWRVSSGAILFDDLQMGELIDQSREPRGWMQPGFDDKDWRPVEVGERPHDLLGAEDEPIRVVEVRPALTVVSSAADEHVYDFGQNLVGRVRVRFGGGERGHVRLRYAEALDDGRLYTENLRRADATDEFVLDGDGGVFESVFTFHGFRYLEISGCSAPPVEDVAAQVLGNDLESVGAFRCSDPDVTKLYENVRWGQRGNYLAVPTDCPQRDERLGWLGDAQVFLPTAAYNSDVRAFFRRWLRDVRFGQTPEGSFRDIAPVVGASQGDGAPGWGDAGVIIPWHLYRVYGDELVLRESFDGMRRWVDFVARHNPDGVWRHRVGNNYGDWLQIGAQTPTALLATAFHHRSARLTARAAAVLGEAAEAARLDGVADRIRAAFHATFVEDELRLEGDTQTGYLLAIAFGLARDASDDAAWGEHLVEALDRNDGLLSTGFVGVAHLLPVLQQVGHSDRASALLQNTRYPGWLYSVQRGATTIWERWDGWTEEAGFQSPSMNSFNHYSLGSVGEWLYSGLGGITQTADSVAFDELLIAPQLGEGIAWAESSYESPRGRIATSWRIADDRVSLAVEVPPGASARVRLPVVSAELDGVPVAQSEGAMVEFACPSGRHHVEGVLATARR